MVTSTLVFNWLLTQNSVLFVLIFTAGTRAEYLLPKLYSDTEILYCDAY